MLKLRSKAKCSRFVHSIWGSIFLLFLISGNGCRLYKFVTDSGVGPDCFWISNFRASLNSIWSFFNAVEAADRTYSVLIFLTLKCSFFPSFFNSTLIEIETFVMLLAAGTISIISPSLKVCFQLTEILEDLMVIVAVTGSSHLLILKITVARVSATSNWHVMLLQKSLISHRPTRRLGKLTSGHFSSSCPSSAYS